MNGDCLWLFIFSNIGSAVCSLVRTLRMCVLFIVYFYNSTKFQSHEERGKKNYWKHTDTTAQSTFYGGYRICVSQVFFCELSRENFGGRFGLFWNNGRPDRNQLTTESNDVRSFACVAILLLRHSIETDVPSRHIKICVHHKRRLCGVCVCVRLDKMKQMNKQASKQANMHAAAQYTNERTNEWMCEKRAKWKLISYCSMCLVRYSLFLLFCCCRFISCPALDSSYILLLCFGAGCLPCHLFNLSVSISSSCTLFCFFFLFFCAFYKPFPSDNNCNETNDTE